MTPAALLDAVSGTRTDHGVAGAGADGDSILPPVRPSTWGDNSTRSAATGGCTAAGTSRT